MSETVAFVITGKGVLKEYHGTDEVIRIPDGVKVIGSDLLWYHRDERVKKVIIPEGVAEIRQRAFAASKVEEVVLPASLKKIGKEAFDDCENLARITIPDGIKEIPDSLFRMSGLEEITLPESVEEIGDSAFLFCRNLKKIHFSKLGTVKIGSQAFTGCDSLVDENGLFILQNRVFSYHSEKKNACVIIPDGVEQIENGVFDFSIVQLEMSVHCPTWPQSGTAKVYGFASSLLNMPGSSITFRDTDGRKVARVVLATDGETEPKINGAILSVRSADGRFDFAGYDEYFTSLAKAPNKIKVALARVEYPYMLSDEMMQVYQTYLKKQGEAVGMMLIDEDRIDLLFRLGEMQLFTKGAIQKLIDYAGTKGKTSIKAWLLDYNNRAPGKNTAKAKNAVGTPEAKSRDSGKKAAASWKKPKTGSHLIPRYIGCETAVEFPLEVEGITITGIANTSGAVPENYRSITSVVLPEGYTYIGNKAFSGCEKLETISLPSTLEEIGTQAFAGCKSLKEIVLHEGISFAGKDIFADADIQAVVMVTEKKTRIPAHLFFGCHIGSLVVLGGPFKSNGNVFDYTGAVTGAAYSEKMYDGNFPENVYINGDFSTLDLRGTGGEKAKRIHPLADFDETILLDSSIKDRITAEKKQKGKVVDNAGKIADPAEVGKIDFENSTFVLTGFDYEEEEKAAKEIAQRGGTVRDTVTSSVQYLVVPDRELIRNAKIKKAQELQAKGKPIAVIRLSECRRHLRIHDEAMFGAEGAEIAAEYSLSVHDGKVTLEAYTGSKTDLEIPGAVGPYPVTALGKSCFSEGYKSDHNSKLRSVTVPGTILSLSENSFEYCSELKSVTLSEGVETIEKNAFGECKKLKTLKIPNSVVTIGSGAFNGCSGLESMIIPAGVQSLAAPFGGCDALTKLAVDAANTVYDSRENCNAVIETATNSLVAGCRATVIPASVTAIGESAFSGLDMIQTISIPEGVTEIGNDAFSGCFHLSSLKLPDSLTKIGYYVFSFCLGLKRIELPKHVVFLHASAFSNCENLTELVVNDDLPEIQELENAWMYNWRIKKIYGSAKSIAKSIAAAIRAEYVEI